MPQVIILGQNQEMKIKKYGVVKGDEKNLKLENLFNDILVENFLKL
jgi:hypothetical protein